MPLTTPAPTARVPSSRRGGGRQRGRISSSTAEMDPRHTTKKFADEGIGGDQRSFCFVSVSA